MTGNIPQKTAWVLVNVGTPASTSTRSVKKYLREFLGDPKVIDLPFLLRKFLVHAIIVPFRSPRSAKKYEQIWTGDGSPLLIHMNSLVQKLKKIAPAGTDVFGCMRYGQPALKDFLLDLSEKEYSEVVVLPLYPQYADSTTGSVEQLVATIRNKTGTDNTIRLHKNKSAGSSDNLSAGSNSYDNDRDRAENSSISYNSDENNRNLNNSHVNIRIIDQFYDHPGFIASFAERIRAHDPSAFDHVLFSYHGLPLRQLRKVHPDQPVADCLCHQHMPGHGHHCYRATCYATTRQLAAAADIAPDRCSTSFQSRLSRNWMTPFTDATLKRLAAEGKKKVLVVPASFVADCLETTLEIGTEYRELFIESGGKELVMAESLNSSDRWVETVQDLLSG